MTLTQGQGRHWGQTDHRANRFGSLKCARQITGINGVNGLVLQSQCRLAGLPASGVIEFNIELSLNAGIDVPSGFAVSESNDAGGLHEGKRIQWWTALILIQNRTVV